jgi:hypothetical protein
LVLSRYIQPEAEHKMLLDTLRLRLPSQPLPKISPAQVPHKESAAMAL